MFYNRTLIWMLNESQSYGHFQADKASSAEMVGKGASYWPPADSGMVSPDTHSQDFTADEAEYKQPHQAPRRWRYDRMKAACRGQKRIEVETCRS